MKPQYVYRIKVNENVLRQTFFTDFNIILALCIGIGVGSFFLLHMLDLTVRFFISIILIGAIVSISAIKIDNQKIYEVFPRFIKYLFRKKHVRF